MLGTLASAAGGAFIGLLFWCLSYFIPESPNRTQSSSPQYPMILVGLVCGFLGSLYDSILGATLQATYYSQERKCIIKDFNSQRQDHILDKSIVRVCGINVLSNEAVNFVSIVMTMVSVLWIGPVIFQLCYGLHETKL